MPREINGTAYFSANEAAKEVGVSRQTLWRWRAAAVIPQGRKFRDRQLIFTLDELEKIRLYANRIEPVGNDARSQLKLFSTNRRAYAEQRTLTRPTITDTAASTMENIPVFRPPLPG